MGQHLAYAFHKPASVIVGSTFGINVSYPDEETFQVMDLGEGRRRYSPIRITMDEVADRGNDGIMVMNEKIEDAIVDSVTKQSAKYRNTTTPASVTLTKAPETCKTC